MNISFMNIFGLYMCTRLYFFVRRHGAPIEARSFLLIIVGSLFALFGMFFKFSFWIKIAGIMAGIAAIVYAITGYYKMKKGLLPADNKNIKYNRLFVEIVSVFILSLAIVTLLGLNYFGKGQ